MRRIGRLWCPECFFRLGRALFVWVVIVSVVVRRWRRKGTGHSA